MFDAAPSTDLQAVRRHQKPAPGFVLHPGAPLHRDLLEGDRLELDCLFLGVAVIAIGDFLEILRHVVRSGLGPGTGRYELVAVQALGTSGEWRPLGTASQARQEPVPDLIRLDHWLDGHWPDRLPVTLEVVSPLRLLAEGRVLRAPRFDQLFPFLLRRVTSMLHTYCDLDLVEEPALLIDAARRIRASWIDRRWCDWRDAGAHGMIGGVVGSLQLAGPALDEVLWILSLAPLFGIGKGAAYGAGSCRLLLAK